MESIGWIKQYGDVEIVDRRNINIMLRDIKSRNIDKIIILDDVAPHEQDMVRLIDELDKNDIVCMKVSIAAGTLTKVVSKIYSLEAKLMIGEDKSVVETYPIVGFNRSVLDKCDKIYYPCVLQSLISKNKNMRIKIITSENITHKTSFKRVMLAIWAMLFIGKQTGEFHRLFKFALVGICGIFVNEFLLWLLTEHMGIFYLVSAIFAIETSIVSNFFMNDLWTFRDRRLKGVRNTISRLLKYNVISWSTGSINWIVLAILKEFLGVYYLIANLCGIFVAFVGNFILSSLWAWKSVTLNRVVDMTKQSYQLTNGRSSKNNSVILR